MAIAPLQPKDHYSGPNLFFDKFPSELSISILKYLPASEIVVTCSIVSKDWYLLTKEHSLWKDLIKHDFPHHVIRDYPEEQYKNRILIPRQLQKGSSIIYKAPPTCLKKWTAITMKGDRLVLGVDNGSSHHIQIWNKRTVTLDCTLKEHPEKIETLLFAEDENILLSASSRTVKIWNLFSRKCLHTLTNGLNEIRKLFIKKDQLIVGSSKGEVTFWDLKSGTLTKTWQHPDQRPIAEQTKDGRFIIPNFLQIEIWKESSDNWEGIGLLEKHENVIQACVLRGDQLISGSVNGTIKIWNLSTNSCEKTLNNHKDVLSITLAEDRWLFICSNDTSSIAKWDLNTYHSQYLENENICPSTTLLFSEEGELFLFDNIEIDSSDSEDGESPSSLSILNFGFPKDYDSAFKEIHSEIQSKKGIKRKFDDISPSDADRI
jgi:WD40 repeat protein